MPTRIFFTNGEQVTVSDSPDAVAQKLGGGGLAQLERPWGDESIYVNPAAINYIEANRKNFRACSLSARAAGSRRCRIQVPRRSNRRRPLLRPATPALSTGSASHSSNSIGSQNSRSR